MGIMERLGTEGKGKRGEEEEEEEIWEEVERAESYLVSSMFEEAASIASWIVRRTQSVELLECGAMLLLQSLGPIHNNNNNIIIFHDILNATTIPIPPRLLLTCAGVLMSSSSPSSAAQFLHRCLTPDSTRQFDTSSDDYIALADFYAVNLLATALHDPSRAISWLATAPLPQHAAHEILTRLRSLQHPPLPSPDPHKPTTTQRRLVLSHQQPRLLFWWFRTLNFKFVLPCLALLLYWALRRKQTSVKRMVGTQALNLKKAALQLWALVFSHNLSPLAALQSPIRAPPRP